MIDHNALANLGQIESTELLWIFEAAHAHYAKEVHDSQVALNLMREFQTSRVCRSVLGRPSNNNPAEEIAWLEKQLAKEQRLCLICWAFIEKINSRLDENFSKAFQVWLTERRAEAKKEEANAKQQKSQR